MRKIKEKFYKIVLKLSRVIFRKYVEEVEGVEKEHNTRQKHCLIQAQLSTSDKGKWYDAREKLDKLRFGERWKYNLTKYGSL